MRQQQATEIVCRLKVKRHDEAVAVAGVERHSDSGCVVVYEDSE